MKGVRFAIPAAILLAMVGCAAIAACFSGPLFGGGAHYTYAGDTSTATFFQEPPDIHGQPVFTRHRDDAAVQDSPTGDSP